MDWYLNILKNHYIDFDGRTGRRLFWMFVLVNIGIYIAIAIIVGLISSNLATFIEGLFWLALFLPNIGIGARRLHDTGKSGWLQLIALIPILGWIAIIYLFAQPGDEGMNSYGMEPEDEEVSFG